MKKIIIAVVTLFFVSLFVSGSLFAQEKKTLTEKDTVIRLQFGGMVGFTPSATTGADYGTFNLGVNYSRFFTDLMGLNIGVGMEIPLGENAMSGSNLTAMGGSVEAGPCFRLGRILLSPMIGYGLVYQSVDYTNNDSEIKMEHYFRIIFGVDFFITDFLSLSGEVGYIVGYVTDKYEVDTTGATINSVENPQGFCFSLGVGIAY